MAGALFYRGQSIMEIRDLPFHELSYWYEWHKAIAKEETKPPPGKGK